MEPRKIKIKEIKIISDYMPREELDKTLVEAYAENIDKLPPILLNQDKILVDGWHRLEAHILKGLTEISYIEIQTKNEREILEEATKANATHGKQLTMKEKEKIAIKLFN